MAIAGPAGAGSGRGGQAAAPDPDAAIRALYAQHGHDLLMFARHLTGDVQRAEDIVQETMLRAWRSGGVESRTWLFTVARNLAVDAYRARRARPQESAQPFPGAVLPGDAPDPDRLIESWAVADALRALKPDHRAVILETYYRDRSVAEAAAALGIPAGTVKSRTYYALRALGLELQERGLAS
jgi:RNA polymerase sigma-70 factor (ECF subfamily)